MVIKFFGDKDIQHSHCIVNIVIVLSTFLSAENQVINNEDLNNKVRSLPTLMSLYISHSFIR